MKEAILFIDGSNLYHNSKDIGVSPGMIDFKKLCEFICRKTNYLWKKTYYYNAIPDINDGREVYYSHIKFLNNLKKINKFEVRTRKLQKLSTAEIQKEKKQLIKNSNLCDKCKKEAVKNCLNCIGDYNKKEKGIDVMIAVNMIESILKKECKACILVSGDADFIPSLKLVEENKGEVVICSPKAGFASELRQKYRHIYLKKEEIEENCYK